MAENWSPERDFTQFVADNQADVTRYVIRRFRGDVHDVVSDVFAIAWQKRSTLPDDRIQRRAWLFATARRVIANRVRWRKRLDRFSTMIEPLVESETTLDDDNRFVVHQALGNLREQDRELLMLTEWDGLSIAETARVLSIPETTVSSRLRAARSAFRRVYETLTSTPLLEQGAAQ